MRAVLLLLADVLAVAAVVAGTVMIYLPAGLIVAGLLGIVAAERASERARARVAADPQGVK